MIFLAETYGIFWTWVVMLMASFHFITANKTTAPVVSMGTSRHIASPVKKSGIVMYRIALSGELCKQSKTWYCKE